MTCRTAVESPPALFSFLEKAGFFPICNATYTPTDGDRGLSTVMVEHQR